VGPAPSPTVTADIADNAAAPGSQNDTIARTDGGSWLDDGLRAGELIGVSGDANPVNSGVFRIDQVNDTVITLEADAALADSAGTTITVEQLFRVDFSDNAGAADPRDTITRTDGGSWLDDAFRIGTFLVVAGDAEPGNNGVIFKVNAVTDTVLTLTTSASLTDSTGSLITIQRKEPAVTFTTANWFEEVGIAVTADESFVLDPGQVFLRREPLRPHTIDDVTGPLILEGGVAEERDRSLNRAVMLPTEFTEAPLDLVIEGDESQRADRLNVFNDSSVSHDRGELRAIELRNDVVKLGDEDPTNDIRPMNLSGFGMSTGLTIDISEAQLGLDPDLIIDFPGGITFDDIEVTEILLGKGNDRLDIVDSNNRERGPVRDRRRPRRPARGRRCGARGRDRVRGHAEHHRRHHRGERGRRPRVAAGDLRRHLAGRKPLRLAARGAHGQRLLLRRPRRRRHRCQRLEPRRVDLRRPR
jgi:hypothetical protein